MNLNGRSFRGLTGAMVVTLGLLGLCVASGCESGGRSARAQTVSSSPTPPRIASLKEATDEAAQWLARDLAELQETDFKGQRVGIIMGDLVNRAPQAVSTNELEITRERLVDKIMSSRTFRENFVFFKDRARWEAAKAREVVPSNDPAAASRPDVVSQPQRSMAEYFYQLDGELDGVFRPDEKLYIYRFKLVRLSDGAEVWRRSYEPSR